MQLSEQYYDAYPNITSLEEFTVTVARDFLKKQKNSNFNGNNLDYVDVNTDEEEEKISIDLKEIPCYIENGELFVKSLFSEVFLQGTGPYPFNRKSRIGALVHVVMFQHKKELEPNISSLEPKISYDFVSQGTVGLFPLFFSANLSNLPLIVESVGAVQTTRAKTYLSGIFE